MSDSRVIKLGKDYFNVKEKGGELVMEPATLDQTTQEIIEAHIITGEMGPDYNPLQATLDKTREEILKNLNNGIKDVVLKCLGFQKDWGDGNGWRVDHCNGRMSKVSEYIAFEVKDMLAKVSIDDIQSLLSEKDKKEIREGFRKDMKENYTRYMRDTAWQMAQNMAREDAKKIADTMFKERSEAIAKVLLDRLVVK